MERDRPDPAADAAARAGIPVDEASVAAAAARAEEERQAAARASSIEAGRRVGGLAGAALAGSMLALRDIYEGPPKDEIPIEIEASGAPHDVDRDGITLSVTVDGDAVDVRTPPLPRRDP